MLVTLGRALLSFPRKKTIGQIFPKLILIAPLVQLQWKYQILQEAQVEKKRRICAIIIIFTSHKLAISAAVTEELPPLASNETNSPSEDR